MPLCGTVLKLLLVLSMNNSGSVYGAFQYASFKYSICSHLNCSWLGRSWLRGLRGAAEAQLPALVGNAQPEHHGDARETAWSQALSQTSRGPGSP